MIEQETVPGRGAAHPRGRSEDQPVVSVIMSRDLGDVRMPGAVLTIVSGLLFLVTLVMLHQRDLRAAAGARAPPGAGRGLATMGQYLPVVALAVLAVLFAALSRVASQLLAPSATTIAKRSPYECGIVPGREPPERFPVRFYLIAMIFIVFDIEIIFLYPWAVIYRNLGAFGLAEILLFTVAVLVSFVYLLSNGALDWGPAKRARRLSPMVVGRAHHRHHDQAGRPRRPRGPRRRRGGLRCSGTSRRGSRASTTTSSPASSKTS